MRANIFKNLALNTSIVSTIYKCFLQLNIKGIVDILRGLQSAQKLAYTRDNRLLTHAYSDES